MSVESIVQWIGEIAPATFAVATIAAVSGSFVTRWYTRRLLSAGELEKFEMLVKELSTAQSAEEQSEELAALQLEISALLAETKEKPDEVEAGILLAKVARLSEYITNRSPVDSLVRRAVR